MCGFDRSSSSYSVGDDTEQHRPHVTGSMKHLGTICLETFNPVVKVAGELAEIITSRPFLKSASPSKVHCFRSALELLEEITTHLKAVSVLTSTELIPPSVKAVAEIVNEKRLKNLGDLPT